MARLAVRARAVAEGFAARSGEAEDEAEQTQVEELRPLEMVWHGFLYGILWVIIEYLYWMYRVVYSIKLVQYINVMYLYLYI